MNRATIDRVSEICKNRYEHLLKDDDNVFISNFGILSQGMVNKTLSEIEGRLFSSGEKKTVVKKVFSILVEGLQNIRIHGEHDSANNQLSFFIVKESKTQFKVYLGNLIFNSNVEKITNRIDKLNKLNKAEVKALYLDVLTNGVISNKGGAGLGFITMAMKSLNSLKSHFEKIDDDISQYDLQVVIDKAIKR